MALPFSVISVLILNAVMVECSVAVVIALPVGEVPATPILTEEHVTVPAPLSVRSILFLPSVIVNAFVMVSVIPEFTDMVAEMAAAVDALKLIDLQVVLAVTVILEPAAIITSSAEVGTTPPDQVAVEFQLPVLPALVMVPAKLWMMHKKKYNTVNASALFVFKGRQVCRLLRPPALSLVFCNCLFM